VRNDSAFFEIPACFGNGGAFVFSLRLIVDRDLGERYRTGA
jgi:hypothetical protein